MNNLRNKIIVGTCRRLPNVIASKYSKYEETLRDGPEINPQKLPLLPIPKLENTLCKFLESCEPLVTHSDLEDCRKICKDFQENEGRRLQKYLIKKASVSENWLDEWYTRCAYLCNRNPLPMGTTPVLTFPTKNFQILSDQKEYTAKLILAVLKFRKLCYCNDLPVDTSNDLPLDMGVYKKLFGTIRIPNQGCDYIELNPNSQHIVIIINNNFFKMKVLDSCGESLSFTEIMSRLDEIVINSEHAGTPVGLLTCLNRDKWADFYEHMKKLPNNEDSIKSLNQALFTVCMDKPLPREGCSENEMKLQACKNGFHGHGPKINGGNRWYGKTLQFFVTRDGCSGIIFEHSPVEAIPLSRMTDFIIDFMSGRKWMDVPKLLIRDKPIRLEFNTSKAMTDSMTEVSKDLQERIKKFWVEILHYQAYGKEFIKKSHLSPDAVIQIALQYAHIQYHSRVVSQHESATTRRFFLGRTDTIRSCTKQVLGFIKCMGTAAIPTGEKYEMLKVASKKHKKLTNDVMVGKGIDRHLFGLLMASKEMEMSVPCLFRSRAYDQAGKFKIVSRQNPTKKNCFTCFAPGLDGGYGCCYNPRSEDINMCVTCWRDDECDPREFLDAWECSMKIISDLLLRYKYREHKKLCK